MPPEFLSPEAARELLEAADRRNAKLRAEHPTAAHVFPPVSDELFRQVIERALLGELRNSPLLPPFHPEGRRLMTDDPKPTITPEEMQRRRGHVRAAIADSRLEGSAPSAAELEILEAYIRGEIEAADLVTVYLNRRNRS